MNALAAPERWELGRLERVVQRAVTTALEAAHALREIRDRRLYRERFASFEAYCSDKWGMSRQHANRLCDWSGVAENVTPIGVTLAMESHARPLSRLTPGQQRVAARRVRDLPAPTAADIERVCRQVRATPVAGRNGHVALEPVDDPPAALSWLGGKSGSAKNIVRLLPPHKTYVEPYLGSGAVLFAKPPSTNEIVNDRNGDVVNYFRVLRDRPKQLLAKLRLTPYARDEHAFCKAHTGHPDPVERARRFFVRVKQSYAAIQDDAFTLNTEYGLDVATFVDKLHRAAERLRWV